MTGRITTGEAALSALSISIQVSNREHCNAGCRFCISRTTANCDAAKPDAVERCDFRRLRVGLRYAERLGATHTILTGKADPLQENQAYLQQLISESAQYTPLVDIHTNGWGLQSEEDGGESYLEKLVISGLTNITYSIASFNPEVNFQLMRLRQDAPQLISLARSFGLNVRCSLVINKQGVTDFSGIVDYIRTAGSLGSHLVTLREVWLPNNALDDPVFEWNKENRIDIKPLQQQFIDAAGQGLHGLAIKDPLPWGQPVFTMNGGEFGNSNHGVNITFARCDEASTGRILKSIVHKPNGHGYRNWDDPGDILY